MARTTSARRSSGKLDYTGSLCGLAIVVAWQIVLCSGQVTFGPDHKLFDVDNLPDQAPSQRFSSREEETKRRPQSGSSARFPFSEQKEQSDKRRPEGHQRFPSSEEEEEVKRKGTHEVDSHENSIVSEKHREESQETKKNGGWSNEIIHSSEAGIHIEIEEKTENETESVYGPESGTKTFDTKTFLNGVSILTGQPDPEHCEILDAWACNAEQTKAVCPNRCAKLGQAVDAPWCQKDKQEALCNHHDARWMCPSFCAAIDAKDCNLFEDWVCKAEKAKKICPERCNNVNFTTDAPWCAQHGDNAGCSWLCMNPDANQMCSYFCLLHGFPLIGQNGLPMGIPPGLLNGIPGVSEYPGNYPGIQHPTGTQYGNPGTIKQGMGGTRGIPGIGVYEHFMKLKNRQRIHGGNPGESGRLIGSVLGSQIGPSGSQTGYQGPQTGYAGSQTGYTGSQIEYQGPQAGYTGSQTGSQIEYQGPQAGYQGPQAGYQGPQAGYQGSQQGYQGPHAGYTGSQTGYSGPQAGYMGPQTGIQDTQIGYSESQSGYPGSQTGFPVSYPEAQSGYQGAQTGYPGSPIGSPASYPEAQSGYPGSQSGYQEPQTGYPGSPIGHPGSQSGYSLESDCLEGSVPGYPEVTPCELQAGIQVAYPEEGFYGNGIQSTYDIESNGVYDTGSGSAYETGSSGAYATGSRVAYDTGSSGAYGAGSGGAYDAGTGVSYI